MSKYVVFSFDDGRLDTYTYAFPILKKYGFSATINVTTDFIDHPEKYTNFKSANNRAMNWEQVLDLYQNGWEIASHGHTHKNDGADIEKSIIEFEKHNISVNKIGFASPNSEINEQSYGKLMETLPEKIFYVRSGLQVRREGLFYAGLTVFNQKIKSKKIFCFLNKKCKLSLKENLTKKPVLSVGVASDMSVKSLISLLKTLSDDECYILMFHSILSPAEEAQKVDRWFWETEKFENLCRWLKDHKEYQVITTKQLIDLSERKI